MSPERVAIKRRLDENSILFNRLKNQKK